MVYNFSYREHNFEIEVNNEKIITISKGERKERITEVFSFSCDREINYSVICKSCWRATNTELRNKIQLLYEIINKHYRQSIYNNIQQLKWNDFLKLLPKDFKENYLYKVL